MEPIDHDVHLQDNVFERRHRIASLFLVVFLLTIPFKETRIFSQTVISVYRMINLLVILPALLFFIKIRVRFKLLSPTLLISGCFSIWILFTCFFSTDLMESSIGWFMYILQYFVLSIVTFFCIKTMNHCQERHFVLIAKMMQLVGLILSLSILLNFFFAFELDIFSTHTDSIYTASLLGGTFPTLLKIIVGMSMSMFLFSYHKQKKELIKSIFSLLISLICLISLFLSGTRVGVGLGLFLMFMALIRWVCILLRQKPRTAIGMIIFMLFVFYIAKAFIHSPMADQLWFDSVYGGQFAAKTARQQDLLAECAAGDINDKSSFGQRIILLTEFGSIFTDTLNNILFGVGFLQSYKYSTLRLDLHNAYLSFFAETGIIGGLLFLALVMQIGKSIYKQYRAKPDTYFFLWLAYLSMAIFFLFETTLRYSLIWQFFIPLALFFENSDSSPTRNRKHITTLYNTQLHHRKSES